MEPAGITLPSPAPLRDGIHRFDRDIAHQQKRFHVRKQSEFLLQQQRTFLDGVRRDAVSGFAAFHRRREIHAEIENIADRRDIGARVLERLNGRLLKERIPFGIVIVGEVRRRGFRDQHDGNIVWFNLDVRNDVALVLDIGTGKSTTRDFSVRRAISLSPKFLTTVLPMSLLATSLHTSFTARFVSDLHHRLAILRARTHVADWLRGFHRGSRGAFDRRPA